MIKKLSSRIVYENPWMKVREDDVEFADGTKGIYGVVDKIAGSLVIPKLHHDEYVLVKTYRYTTENATWEFPNGGVEDETLSPEEVARIELREETGYSSKHMIHLASLHVAYGYSTQIMHMYLADGLIPGQPKRDRGEMGMEMRTFSSAHIETMMIRGEITDAQSVAAWGMLTMRENRGT